METVLFYKGKHIFTQACKYLALLGLAFLFFLPIYWVFKGSLQPNADNQGLAAHLGALAGHAGQL